jgi:hypothetical protein
MDTKNIDYNLFKIESKEDLKLNDKLKKMLERPISLPGEYLLSKRVPAGAKIFWLHLNLVSNIDGESWWYQENMARIFRLSESKIKRYVKKLKEVGWLEVGKHKKSRSNLYKLIWPETCKNPRILAAQKKAKIRDLEEKNRNSTTQYHKKNNQRRRNNNDGFQSISFD